MSQAELDIANARFWDHICGTALNERIHDPGIAAFDQAYLALYPWLEQTVLTTVAQATRVLEVGPGYGTVGRIVTRAGCDYWAIDIAPNVITHTRKHTGANAYLWNVLELDQFFDAGLFDAVIAIGSLHHTGNMPLAIQQLHRVLSPGGRLLAMIYGDGGVRDWNLDGAPAPHTDITPPRKVPALFSEFHAVETVQRRPHDYLDIYVLASKG